jgi:hypothetical protein
MAVEPGPVPPGEHPRFGSVQCKDIQSPGTYEEIETQEEKTFEKKKGVFFVCERERGPFFD